MDLRGLPGPDWGELEVHHPSSPSKLPPDSSQNQLAARRGPSARNSCHRSEQQSAWTEFRGAGTGERRDHQHDSSEDPTTNETARWPATQRSLRKGYVEIAKSGRVSYLPIFMPKTDSESLVVEIDYKPEVEDVAAMLCEANIKLVKLKSLLLLHTASLPAICRPDQDGLPVVENLGSSASTGPPTRASRELEATLLQHLVPEKKGSDNHKVKNSQSVLTPSRFPHFPPLLYLPPPPKTQDAADLQFLQKSLITAPSSEAQILSEGLQQRIKEDMSKRLEQLYTSEFPSLSVEDVEAAPK